MPVQGWPLPLPYLLLFLVHLHLIRCFKVSEQNWRRAIYFWTSGSFHWYIITDVSANLVALSLESELFQAAILSRPFSGSDQYKTVGVLVFSEFSGIHGSAVQDSVLMGCEPTSLANPFFGTTLGQIAEEEKPHVRGLFTPWMCRQHSCFETSISVYHPTRRWISLPLIYAFSYSEAIVNVKDFRIWPALKSFWLHIQRSRVRFPALPDFLSNSGSGTGSTQPREVNWGATWIKSSDSGPENRD